MNHSIKILPWFKSNQITVLSNLSSKHLPTGHHNCYVSWEWRILRVESATLFRPDAPPTLPASNSTLHLKSKILIELLESSSSSTWTNSPPTRRFTWIKSNSSHRTLLHIPHKGLSRHSWMLHSSLLNKKLQCNATTRHHYYIERITLSSGCLSNTGLRLTTQLQQHTAEHTSVEEIQSFSISLVVLSFIYLPQSLVTKPDFLSVFSKLESCCR